MLTASVNISDLPYSLWTVNGAMVLIVSIVVTSLLIPRILTLSHRRHLFDSIDERKIHDGFIPRLGGIAFVPAIILALSSVAGLDLLLMGPQGLQALGTTGGNIISLCFGLCALMLMYLLGLADDLMGIGWKTKLIVQIIAAYLIVGTGLSLGSLNGFLGIYEMPVWVDQLLSVLVIVLVINAINLIDGIDGLASALSSMACGYYVVASYNTSAYSNAMLGLATIGTLLPFFIYNVFGSVRYGKKIFMGDTGALTTGLILSFLALRVLRVEYSNGNTSTVPLVVAFTPLVVPCLDVVRVVIHRIARGQSPFCAGRCHIHHKLLALGLRQRYAMLLIFVISGFYIAMNLLLCKALSAFSILIIDSIVWFAGNWLLTLLIRRRQNRMPETRLLYQ
ncbi:MAG: undecaprenyl/decaprenyl-phosphate alpha-N-acetylglucosaminyl 1-phosphate transferase [Muribaculaceae bacterium]|nr:undecaprenyl/decaprenyl-phosphate alpha-N-acetylglucosaminyl 1-phosphate transferase [Muribaculaceae bacterium]MDE5968700.1 undecaprenyl/decaprenyl-phosphate alpha-N-acetylglucosaminyl 1-phosphate transferase [Muribaculaceae bacterium]MDE7394244.1 undecaprenyl/decaprenyl-phosphate alpha-N-acetylglucosaminyl 1-phosphate transferase [Muribaculaceae bacterium]